MHFLKIANRFAQFERVMSFYAVARGHKVGIYDTWVKCEEQVKGFKGAKYKKFPTRQEAEDFIVGPTSAKATSSRNQYAPQDIAVPLGKKGTLASLLAGSTNSEKTPASTDFWPESDGDSFEDNGLSDDDLLAAMAEVEGLCEIKQDQKSLKRQYTDAASNSSSRSSKVPKHESIIWESAGVKTIGAFEFQIDAEGFVIVYTDGSCINNGSANASAGFGVYFDDNHPLNAAKPVLGRVTNNVGEIQAAIYAIKIAKDLGVRKLCINTDSQFLINAITSWITAWKRKNWRLKNGEPVKNVVDFKELDELLQDNLLNVKWNYVKAHKGIKGNEMADKLAREGSDIYKRLNSKIKA